MPFKCNLQRYNVVQGFGWAPDTPVMLIFGGYGRSVGLYKLISVYPWL